jgi:ATP-dependent DNA helicase RecQ
MYRAAVDNNRVETTLTETFGFETMRPGQAQVIDTLLAGRSALAVFPTGGGKSLCYQLPATLLDGLTVVVSPLIALMKDQIDALAKRGVAAARLDSTLDGDSARGVYRDLRNGRLKLLYVAPERLGNERFLSLLSDVPIDLMAVDEAHCISEWGHNFRPDYLRLARLAKRLNVGRVLALTATATPDVERQVAAGFDVATDDVVRTPMHRPNLSLAVEPHDDASRDERLATLLREIDGAAVVYVTKQQTAEDVAAALTIAGVRARPYHAGLKAEQRDETQEWFMATPDAVVVATIAFGMGIDKADIRGVVHYNPPKSPENYAQEVGRAGRDGEPATCTLLYVPTDLTPLENFSYGDTPSPRNVAMLTKELLSLGNDFDVSVYDLSGRFDIRPLVIETLLTYLELDGILERLGPFYATYGLKPRRPFDEIVADFDQRRQALLQQLFDAATHKKTWSYLDLADVDAPRDKVLAALNYLESQGNVELKPTGVRLAFRRVAEPDLRELSRTLADRFAERERRDIERLHKMKAYAESGGGWRPLLEYFGESTDGVAANESIEVPPRPRPEPNDADHAAATRLIALNHVGLSTPRQVTRYLCGIPSPMTSRDRTIGRQDFGRCGTVPFPDVLAMVKDAAGK